MVLRLLACALFASLSRFASCLALAPVFACLVRCLSCFQPHSIIASKRLSVRPGRPSKTEPSFRECEVKSADFMQEHCECCETETFNQRCSTAHPMACQIRSVHPHSASRAAHPSRLGTPVPLAFPPEQRGEIWQRKPWSNGRTA